MKKYVDGFVIPIAKDRVDDYRKMAEAASRIWKELGALDYWECVGDDLESCSEGGSISFLKMAGAKPDETVIFAWIVYESREHRDKVNEQIMSDPRLKEMMDADNPPFDFKRIAFGGFRELVRG